MDIKLKKFFISGLMRTTLQSSAVSNGMTGTQPEVTNISAGNQPHFNNHFIQLWKGTKNYQEWVENKEATKLLAERLPPGHPYSGSLSMADMKLHLTHTIGNSEGGKRVTQAVANTSKALVGGISTAKGALSSWITSFKAPASSIPETEQTS